MRNAITAAVRWLRTHVELTAILPLLLAAMAAAWFVTWARGLPLLEVGPILLDYLVGLVPTALLGYLAWRFKAEYWHDLDADQERELHTEAKAGNRWAFWLIVKDRLEWLAMFILLAFVFSLFSGTANASTGARELIVRWEVGGQQRYIKQLQRPVWPGGASGVTWGIGYDGGHQHRDTILRDWGFHWAAPRLATTAGLTGETARAALPRYRDIEVIWADAIRVLDTSSIPVYRARARRAYGRAFDLAPPEVQDALTSEVYNRGTSMAGSSRAERRRIRDVCLPAGDVECVADALEDSCRVWAGTPNYRGLCARRRDEARIARGAMA